MTQKLYTESYIEDIADAIRSKGGSGTFTVSEMAQAIEDLPSGSSGWSTDGIASGTEPNGDITISASVSSIMTRAFYERTGITSVTLEGNPLIGTYAFSGCTNMVTLNVPNLVALKSTRYNTSQYTFQGCSKLVSVSFPSFGNEVVDSYVFYNCTSLEVADFKQVQRFANTFGGCTKLRTLVLRGNNVTALAGWNQNVLGGIYSNPSESVIYVPSAMISSYQTATNWSNGYALGLTFSAIEGSIYE